MKEANSGSKRSLSASTNVRSRNLGSSFDQTTSKSNGQNTIQKPTLQQRKGSKKKIKSKKIKTKSKEKNEKKEGK
jgi:hypothetical protein